MHPAWREDEADQLDMFVSRFDTGKKYEEPDDDDDEDEEDDDEDPYADYEEEFEDD